LPSLHLICSQIAQKIDTVEVCGSSPHVPIVEEQALISVLKNKQIAGAAIDVFDTEPLPASHPFRTLDNVLTTPHIGYVSHGLYKTFYEDTVSNIRKWLDTHQGVSSNSKSATYMLGVTMERSCGDS
jgi:phosphoglycerate dehydrogenase-like enzyme